MKATLTVTSYAGVWVVEGNDRRKWLSLDDAAYDLRREGWVMVRSNLSGTFPHAVFERAS